MVKRESDEYYLADDITGIDHANTLITAVGRGVAVVAHDEHTAGRYYLNAGEVYVQISFFIAYPSVKSICSRWGTK